MQSPPAARGRPRDPAWDTRRRVSLRMPMRRRRCHQLGNLSNSVNHPNNPCVFVDNSCTGDWGIFDRELTSGDEVETWTHSFASDLCSGFVAGSVFIEIPEMYIDGTASSINVDGSTQTFCGERVLRLRACHPPNVFLFWRGRGVCKRRHSRHHLQRERRLRRLGLFQVDGNRDMRAFDRNSRGQWLVTSTISVTVAFQSRIRMVTASPMATTIVRLPTRTWPTRTATASATSATRTTTTTTSMTVAICVSPP